MFRKLLLTTAVASLVAGGAFAQEQTAPAAPMPAVPAETTQPAAEAPAMKADGLLAANIIGESVYNGTGDDAEKIGDVSDLVIDPNGMVKSMVVGVGGFLGVGQKDVEVDYKSAEWTERNGDRWIVMAMTKDQLQALPEFDRTPYDPTPPATTGSTTTAPAPADNMTTPPAAAPATQEPQPAN
ncbi:MAG: PRC-barrel domain-containing protein [Rhizobiaceae bacterium]|nr:PRC-barrel domain-containing protein [Rhizobiaceae bacterium]